MSNSSADLQRKIGSAGDLLSVVRTMKAIAATNINQFEGTVSALEDYFYTVQLGLMACFRQSGFSLSEHSDFSDRHGNAKKIGILVFGSDQGLVGQFNDSLADFVIADLAQQKAEIIVWVIGERMHARLAQSDLTLEAAGFMLPKAISAISPLLGEILSTMEAYRSEGKINEVAIFHNRPDPAQSQSGVIYTPIKQRLLPLDAAWQTDIMAMSWPTSNLPEVFNTTMNGTVGDTNHDNHRETRLALVHEYLFVSLYRACAESLASENASRLAAMQRAEKNIDEILLTMNSRFHSVRQSAIDEELFDVVSGFTALTNE